LLCLAAAVGDRETVEVLVECGARVSATTSLGQSPLHFAAANGHVDVGTNEYKSKTLSRALFKLNNIVRTLLELDAAPAPSNKYGATPLHLAAAANRAAVCALLCRHAAPLDVRTARGATPFHCAATLGNDVRLVARVGFVHLICGCCCCCC
jgi:ankyrin repeat protein